MVKLSEKEVENLIDKEEGRGGYLGEDLPRDAHSVFRFDIKETSKDLLKEIKTLPKKHFPDVQKIDEDGGVHFYKGDSKASWEYYEDDKGHMFLSDPDFYSRAEVKITNDGLDIVTAWSGYTYNIKDKGDGLGAEVEFHGPLNALLKQNLLPLW